MTMVRIEKLTGVYNANGGVLGEVAYALKAAWGAHCALCDITHRGLRRSREWEDASSEIGVPVELVHLNERSEEIRNASEGRTPCILAHTSGGIVLLIGPDELAQIGGSAARLKTEIVSRASSSGLLLSG